METGKSHFGGGNRNLHPIRVPIFWINACLNDPALQKEVESLLDFDNTKADILEQTAFSAVMQNGKGDFVGKQIGNYKIIGRTRRRRNGRGFSGGTRRRRIFTESRAQTHQTRNGFGRDFAAFLQRTADSRLARTSEHRASC